MRRVGLLVSVMMLGGCATQIQQHRMEKNLNVYIGRSVAEFVAERGYPTETVALSDTISSFHWQITGTGVGAVVPVGGSYIVAPPRAMSCDVFLRAEATTKAPQLRDWIILSWSWRGAC